MEPSTTPISGEVLTNRQVSEALVLLDELTPVDHSKDKTPFEALTDRWSKRSMLCSAAGLVALMILAAIDWAVGLSHGWAPWVLALGVAVVGLPLAAWLMNIAANLWTLLRFRQSAARMRQASLQHDIDAAQKLQRFPMLVLQILDAWLERHNARHQSRLAMFFGGSDKVALVSITVLGVTLLRQFTGAFEDVQKMFPGLSVAAWHWISGGVYLVLAGITGLAIGGVMLRLVMDRTAYQRDLLKLALDAHERRARARQVKSDTSSGRQAR